MKKKRLLGILLSITLILGLTPGVCMTAHANNSYDLYIAGVPVTDANKGDVLGDGTVSFTPAVGETPATLTLNGANITYNEDSSSAIQIGENASDLTIKLKGHNNVGPPQIPSLCCGISSKRPNITITGSGSDSDSLSVSGEYGIKSEDKQSYGNITIKNANVTATGFNTGLYADYGTITIKNSTFIANGTLDHGISSNSNSICIDNGIVTATGYSSGIKTQSGTINISGGDTTVIAKSTNNESSGIIIESNINDNSLIINGGTVIAEGKKGHGITSEKGGIIIDGGTITATGGDGYGIKSSSSLTITDGSVTASGTNKAIDGNVKNWMKGIGWSDPEGTKDYSEISIDTHGHDLIGFKKVAFPDYAEVTTPPTPKSSTYDGQEHELLATTGAAIRGTMKYVVSDSNTTYPNTWDTAVPKRTDIGTYYVWYKAEGTYGFNDSVPKFVTATITDPNPPTPIPPIPVKPYAVVTKAPEVTSLIYNGQPQELVAKGEAVGGTMEYAIGIDATTGPTDGWSKEIPTATDDGTYYIWYRVVGDKKHKDVAPSYVGVTTITGNHSDNVLSIDEEKGIAVVKDDVAGGTAEVPIEVITEGPIYRMYDPNRGEHLFTKKWTDVEVLLEWGWIHESDSDFTVVDATDEDAVPVYRLYNPNFGGMHYYTDNAEDAKYLASVGWNYEGISHYVYNASSTKGTPQYKLYNPNSPSGEHIWLSDESGINMLIDAGWIYEGICWRIA